VTRSGNRRESSEPERQPRRRAGGLHRDFACERAVARPKPPARKNCHNLKILNITYFCSDCFIMTIFKNIFCTQVFLENCTKMLRHFLLIYS
jgi:hypothetical protein